MFKYSKKPKKHYILNGKFTCGFLFNLQQNISALQRSLLLAMLPKAYIFSLIYLTPPQLRHIILVHLFTISGLESQRGSGYEKTVIWVGKDKTKEQGEDIGQEGTRHVADVSVLKKSIEGHPFDPDERT